jgi:formylglycine-generating enzyme required for sulfatase activity
MKNKSIILGCAVVLSLLGMQVRGDCPSMDITGDCKVNLADFAVFASQWLSEGVRPITWVSIKDPGFNGEMSKYETTNAQYCQYLNDAMASNLITVYENNRWVYATNDTEHVKPYFCTEANNSWSQIAYSGGAFSVRSRDGNSMADHPVVMVSWYGATAFCDYYGYRLPTEGEWQAVASYKGTYTYGCGDTISQSIANYFDVDYANPLHLTDYPYTSPVGYYPAYGYGMCDMAGNVYEWTSPVDSEGSYRVFRGGSWAEDSNECMVLKSDSSFPDNWYYDYGFRVCRNPAPVVVPDVVGMTQAEAQSAITAASLVAGTITQVYHISIPSGQVISSAPVADSTVKSGSAVNLLISKGVDGPGEMVWVEIDDSGAGMKDFNGTPITPGGFRGEMSKYETTNAQYCQYLNAALASNDIFVDSGGDVIGNSGPYSGLSYFSTYPSASWSQITYSGGTFSVRSRDGSSMSVHPVVMVSWYGATAFCDYYGYRLPTEWEWQAVADYDGTYIYSCGTTLNMGKVNYLSANPLHLTDYPYTSPVGYYPAYGYGLCDMSGNASEWTSTYDNGHRVIRGGGFDDDGTENTFNVSVRNYYSTPDHRYDGGGFRVCR